MHSLLNLFPKVRSQGFVHFFFDGPTVQSICLESCLAPIETGGDAPVWISAWKSKESLTCISADGQTAGSINVAAKKVWILGRKKLEEAGIGAAERAQTFLEVINKLFNMLNW